MALANTVGGFAMISYSMQSGYITKSIKREMSDTRSYFFRVGWQGPQFASYCCLPDEDFWRKCWLLLTAS
eukprot:2449963-Karenia_brevis.AAC.1